MRKFKIKLSLITSTALIFICTVGFWNCNKDEQTNLTEESIDSYLSEGYQEKITEVVSAINYGLINAPLIEVESTDDIGLRSVSMEIDYAAAESIALERLGINPIELRGANINIVDTLSDEEVAQTIELMSEEMLYFNDEIINLFSIFEDDVNDEGWNKDSVIDVLVTDISNIEKSILCSNTLQGWEKTALLTSTVTAKSFTLSFKELALNIDNAMMPRGFFKKVWKGIAKVAKAVANVAVAATVTVARTVGYSLISGVYGAGNNSDSGLLGAAFAGAGCAIAGAVTGFFGGISKGFKCKAFDVRCMMGDFNDIPCVN